ncbi:HlyD family type I secretion periplasmic adaptor subunit [Caulobacter sp. NIBR2454]|uniref:HlyD family type I secretion periplasmic adaptor subunit n=1 Tax=Caulobacter sp. NIBR2454 TaxID=3015996 RepID=UPI0022B72122|nr:HlyD family type I secretion periplasmic adaptor subunit [Caulobacter sp. NIBR2454]
MNPLLKLPKLSEIFDPKDKSKGVTRIGYGIIIATFGVLGLWAAFAPLDSAVIAMGSLSNETSRKTVQHLEGGIVRAIHVREGQEVTRGQLLFELDPTQANASFEIARNQLLALLAQEARLSAERDNQPSIVWPAELSTAAGDPTVARAVADEQKQFFERRATIRGQVDVLNAQKSQFQSEIEGIDRQSTGLREQVAYVDDELTGLRAIYEKGLVPRPRLLALERERASLNGSIGRLQADRSKAQQGVNEVGLKIRQLQQQFYEQVSQEIAEVRVKIADIREREVVAADQVKRINLVSPANGVVQNLRVFTVGAVIRPGEAMVDVAPQDEALLIHAQFAPTDVDNIHNGMRAEVRLSSFHSRKIPVLEGTIMSISRDRITSEDGKTAYFLAIVRVDQSNLPKEVADKLSAGMPAEVIVPTGERTMLQYLFEPLSNTLRKTMREE